MSRDSVAGSTPHVDRLSCHAVMHLHCLYQHDLVHSSTDRIEAIFSDISLTPTIAEHLPKSISAVRLAAQSTR